MTDQHRRIPLAASILLLRPGAGTDTSPVTNPVTNPVTDADTDIETGAGAEHRRAEYRRTAPEVFTITRSDRLIFCAGVSAFPGGRIDPADDLPAHLWEGTDLVAWAHRLGVDETTAGMILAGAVRETYEEIGVLLARHADDSPVSPEALAALPDDARLRIEHGELDVGTLLTEHSLLPDVSGMQALSRWITPPGPPRRYDTFFLATALPAGQTPGVLSFEGAASRWTTAAAALVDFRAGRHRLLAPTWSQFRSLLPADTVSEALVPRGPIPPVMPVADGTEGEQVLAFEDAEAFLRDLHVAWPLDTN